MQEYAYLCSVKSICDEYKIQEECQGVRHHGYGCQRNTLGGRDALCRLLLRSLLTEIWIRPAISYGLVACFVTESEEDTNPNQ